MQNFAYIMTPFVACQKFLNKIYCYCFITKSTSSSVVVLYTRKAMCYSFRKSWAGCISRCDKDKC